MITSTSAFLAYATQFVGSGSDLLSLSSWKGGIILALLVGGLTVDIVFGLIDSVKKGGEI